MAVRKNNVVICCRHEEDSADLLAERMRSRIAGEGYELVLNVKVLQGEQFNAQIKHEIENCEDFILLLFPGTLDKCVDGSGDYLMEEISYALKLRKNIVPAITRKFEWPEILPDSIRPLQMFAGVPLNMEFFDAMIEKIRTMLVSNGDKTVKWDENNNIFISYAHNDKERILPVIEELQRQNFCLWYDEGIDPGTEWDDNIAEHVEKCTIMVSFISHAYLDSENCKDELNYARDLGKKRLLVYIEDVKLPGGMSMRLGRQQALYYHKYPDKRAFYDKLTGVEEIEACKMD